MQIIISIFLFGNWILDIGYSPKEVIVGKIRVKTIGADDAGDGKKKKKHKKEEKNLTKVPGMKGGERVQVVGPTEEELDQIKLEDASPKSTKESKTTSSKKTTKDKKRSLKYSENVVKIDKNKAYTLPDAIVLLKKVNYAKFDSTVELDINTTEPGLSGTLKLPHGTGKQVKVVIADDKIIEEIEKGKINFDVLIASPDMMPNLAKVAKVLGPRGLMPNPKNGTIAKDPKEALKEFQGGQLSYKTENKIPVIHVIVGKISYEDKMLAENITTFVSSIKKDRIKKITLSSTMSPGIKILI